MATSPNQTSSALPGGPPIGPAPRPSPLPAAGGFAGQRFAGPAAGGVLPGGGTGLAGPAAEAQQAASTILRLWVANTAEVGPIIETLVTSIRDMITQAQGPAGPSAAQPSTPQAPTTPAPAPGGPIGPPGAPRGTTPPPPAPTPAA